MGDKDAKYQRIKMAIKWLIGNGIAPNQAELGKLMGYTDETAFSKVINGKVSLPSGFTYKLCKLDKSRTLSETWVSEGWGPMIDKTRSFLTEEEKERILENIEKKEKELIMGVPFWNLPVSAGRTVESIIGGYKPDGYIKGLPGADIAENILPVIGVSMEPEISSGALIGVRLMNNWETLNTERIYLIITTEDRMIKRIEHDPENDKILWCISPNFSRFKIYKADIIEIQRVCFVYNPK